MLPHLAFAKQRGIALITVSWIILVLALIISASATVVKNHYGRTQKDINYTKLNLLSQSAIHFAINELVNDKDSILLKNKAQSYQIDGHSIHVTLEHENGKFDINEGDPEFLSALLISYGIGIQEAVNIENNYRELKDTSSIITFHTVDQSKNFFDLNDAVFSCIAKNLTVHSNTAEINLTTAPKGIKKAILWADSNKWHEKVWLTQTEREQLNNSSTPENITKQYDNAGESYTLFAKINSNHQWTRAYKAIVRITKNDELPYWIYSWQKFYPELSQCKKKS